MSTCFAVIGLVALVTFLIYPPIVISGRESRREDKMELMKYMHQDEGDYVEDIRED